VRVFVTGATGFIGSRVVRELTAHGHGVLGLARSDASAQALAAAGAEVLRGDIVDLDSLRAGIAATDGVIHLGFNHDFSKFLENCENDKRAIEAMGAALAGSGKPILITSGVGIGSPGPGRLATEDVFNPQHGNPRIASEIAANAILAAGVTVSVVRLPQVHDPVRQGLISYIVPIAREAGFSAYIGEGLNRWPSAPVDDVARLYRLALERSEAGARYHAVAEEGVAMRAIAETIGKGLGVPAKSITPEEAAGHFGWMGMFASLDMPASSAITRQKLNWHPTGPGIIADLERMDYSR
jgi:nucleoside-diphosphate-sugar epimerase